MTTDSLPLCAANGCRRLAVLYAGTPRAGSDVKLRTADRIRAYMAKYKPAKHKKQPTVRRRSKRRTERALADAAA